MPYDHFRPRNEPARTIYDAIMKAGEAWSDDSPDGWEKTIQLAVWTAARDYAQQTGLRVLTMEEIREAEWTALGHVDYSAKFAYRVRDLLASKQKAPK